MLVAAPIILCANIPRISVGDPPAPLGMASVAAGAAVFAYALMTLAPNLSYLLLVPTIIAALSVGPAGSALTTAAIAAVAIERTVAGVRPFVRGGLNESLIAAQLFIGIIGVVALLLSAVAMNLCLNSRDAMPDGGTLAVETRAVTLDAAEARAAGAVGAGAYALLAVVESGRGMDAETQRRVFEPYFSTKPPGSGFGMGLPMVYGIVRQAGGAITVRSAPGEGAAFSIYLPCRDEGRGMRDEGHCSSSLIPHPFSHQPLGDQPLAEAIDPAV